MHFFRKIVLLFRLCYNHLITNKTITQQKKKDLFEVKAWITKQKKVEQNTTVNGGKRTQENANSTKNATGQSAPNEKRNSPGKNRKKVMQTMGEAVRFPHMGTIKEAADASGLAVYRVRKLVSSGQVRYIKAGRRILVNLDSLAHYMNAGDQPEPVTCGGMQRIPE